MGKAIHAAKRVGIGGKSKNPNVEIATGSGDIRVAGGDHEVTGNIGDYLPSQSFHGAGSHINWGQIGPSIGRGIFYAGVGAALIFSLPYQIASS
jgi:hypothetical protein